jgi:nucleoside-diphosphate-sugar epimerase
MERDMNYFKNKTILVTGATGLIGSNLVKRLMKTSEIRVIANARNEQKLKELFSEYLNNPFFIIYAHDISIPFSFSEKIDLIYHAASPQENKIINNQPLDVIFPNIFGTKNCLDFILKQERELGIKCRMILFSSVTVYKNITNKEITVKESDTEITDKIENNSACYSQSKRMIEVIANGYFKQFGVDIVSARLSTVYGDSEFKTETAFFDFIKLATAGENISINNPLIPKRDNIYIEDALNALLILAEKGEKGDVYNVSSNKELENYASICDIAESIVNITNQYRRKSNLNEIKLIIPKTNSKNIGSSLILDNTKLKSLGWELLYSLEKGLTKTIEANINFK